MPRDAFQHTGTFSGEEVVFYVRPVEQGFMIKPECLETLAQVFCAQLEDIGFANNFAEKKNKC